MYLAFGDLSIVSQRLLVTQHRLSCEKVKSHNTPAHTRNVSLGHLWFHKLQNYSIKELLWRPVLVKIMTIKLHYKSVLIPLRQILWTCCIFLSSINNTFFSVLVIIFSNMSYFCFNYTNTFFIHTMNYFSVVLRIIFLMCIKNYFFIGPRIILRVIARNKRF